MQSIEPLGNPFQERSCPAVSPALLTRAQLPQRNLSIIDLSPQYSFFLSDSLGAVECFSPSSGKRRLPSILSADKSPKQLKGFRLTISSSDKNNYNLPSYVHPLNNSCNELEKYISQESDLLLGIKLRRMKICVKIVFKPPQIAPKINSSKHQNRLIPVGIKSSTKIISLCSSKTQIDNVLSWALAVSYLAFYGRSKFSAGQYNIFRSVVNAKEEILALKTIKTIRYSKLRVLLSTCFPRRDILYIEDRKKVSKSVLINWYVETKNNGRFLAASYERNLLLP